MAGDTYDTPEETVADREQQHLLLTALALRKDECNAWDIFGTRPGLHLGRRQELGDVNRRPIGAALDAHQKAARVLHGHAGWGQRGVPAVDIGFHCPTTKPMRSGRCWASASAPSWRPRSWSAVD
jgi:hypothetical protein